MELLHQTAIIFSWIYLGIYLTAFVVTMITPGKIDIVPVPFISFIIVLSFLVANYQVIS